MSEAVAGIIVAFLVLAGQWVVAHFSKKGVDKTAEVQEEANAVTGFKELVDRLETRLTNVERDNARLASRVETLERERVKDKTLIRYLIDYARRLIAEMRARGIAIPDPPAGIDFDDPIYD